MNHKKILLNLLLVASVITGFIYTLDGDPSHQTYDRSMARIFEFIGVTFGMFLLLGFSYFGYILCRRLLRLLSK